MSIVDVRDLKKAYRRRRVLNGVGLSIERGEAVGILGPNGAGKSTTVECIAGLRRRDAGTVQVLGTDPDDEDPLLRAEVGIQLQETSLPALMTVRQAVELFAGFYDNPFDTRDLIARLGLEDKSDTRFANLSGGQQQRVGVALALVGRPSLAILDEMTAGLDPQARQRIWQMLEELRSDGMSLLLVSHSMQEVERLCDRVVVLKNGIVAAGGRPSELGDAAVQEMRFVPSAEPSLLDLAQVPNVDDVRREGEEVIVQGTGSFVTDVVTHLAGQSISAENIRVESQTLEEGYLQLMTEDGSRS